MKHKKYTLSFGEKAVLTVQSPALLLLIFQAHSEKKLLACAHTMKTVVTGFGEKIPNLFSATGDRKTISRRVYTPFKTLFEREREREREKENKKAKIRKKGGLR